MRGTHPGEAAGKLSPQSLIALERRGSVLFLNKTETQSKTVNEIPHPKAFLWKTSSTCVWGAGRMVQWLFPEAGAQRIEKDLGKGQETGKQMRTPVHEHVWCSASKTPLFFAKGSYTTAKEGAA